MIAGESLLGAQVFSATQAGGRAALGDAITDWIAANPEHELLAMIVIQSSDAQYHCLTIVVFFRYCVKS